MNHLILWCLFNVRLLWVSNIYITLHRSNSMGQLLWIPCFVVLFEELRELWQITLLLFMRNFTSIKSHGDCTVQITVAFKICRPIFLFFSQHVYHWILCKKTLTKNFQQSFSCVIYIFNILCYSNFFEWYWYMVPIIVVYKNFNVNTTHYFIPCLIYVIFFKLRYNRYFNICYVAV